MLFGNRRQQTEAGVNGRMVQKLVIAEIDHAYIGRRGCYASPDRNKHQPAQQDNADAGLYPPTHLRYRHKGKHTLRQIIIGKQEINQESDSLLDEQSGRDTRHRIFGRTQIEQQGAIQTESPIGIKCHIDHKDCGYQQRDDPQINLQGLTEPFPRKPHGYQSQE